MLGPDGGDCGRRPVVGPFSDRKGLASPARDLWGERAAAMRHGSEPWSGVEDLRHSVIQPCVLLIEGQDACSISRRDVVPISLPSRIDVGARRLLYRELEDCRCQKYVRRELFCSPDEREPLQGNIEVSRLEVSHSWQRREINK